MSENCWFCLENLDSEDLVTTCKKCGVLNDREIYKPLTETEENMAIVDTSSVKLPFFKKEDLGNGAEVTIENEIVMGGNFGQYMGTIKLPDGSLKRVGFNMTSVSSMVSAWGNDTTMWVGKKLVFSIEDITNSKTKQILKDCKIFRPVI